MNNLTVELFKDVIKHLSPGDKVLYTLSWSNVASFMRKFNDVHINYLHVDWDRDVLRIDQHPFGRPVRTEIFMKKSELAGEMPHFLKGTRCSIKKVDGVLVAYARDVEALWTSLLSVITETFKINNLLVTHHSEEVPASIRNVSWTPGHVLRMEFRQTPHNLEFVELSKFTDLSEEEHTPTKEIRASWLKIESTHVPLELLEQAMEVTQVEVHSEKFTETDFKDFVNKWLGSSGQVKKLERLTVYDHNFDEEMLLENLPVVSEEESDPLRPYEHFCSNGGYNVVVDEQTDICRADGMMATIVPNNTVQKGLGLETTFNVWHKEMMQQ